MRRPSHRGRRGIERRDLLAAWRSGDAAIDLVGTEQSATRAAPDVEGERLGARDPITGVAADESIDFRDGTLGEGFCDRGRRAHALSCPALGGTVESCVGLARGWSRG
jgi:hypothetical protein